MLKILRRVAPEGKRQGILEKQSIKINIFGRQFPVLVDKDEEAAVLQAAKLINDKMKAYKGAFTGQADLDLALMCCLDLTTEQLKQIQTFQQEADLAIKKLSALESKMDHSLSLFDNNS
jgi:cell division protein ZapA (FtsZ GTPase activity inhibitor)